MNEIIKNMIKKYARNQPELWEDIVQEVELKLHIVSEMRKNRGIKPLQAKQISTIAKHAILDFLYSRKNNYSFKGKYPHYPIPDNLPDDLIEDQTEEEICRRLLFEQIISELNERDKRLITFFYIEGCSCDEIAEKIGVTASTISRRLIRIRKRIKAQYGEEANGLGQGINQKRTED